MQFPGGKQEKGLRDGNFQAVNKSAATLDKT